MIREAANIIGQQILRALNDGQPSEPTCGVSQGNFRTLNALVSALPNCTAAAPGQLLDFLIGLQEIQNLRLAPDKDVLLAVLPKTKDQLRTLWATTISESTMLDVVTETVIGHFLTDRIKTVLIAGAVYWVQASNTNRFTILYRAFIKR